MALTVKHINTDASFLLAFEPVVTNPNAGRPRPFRILLDPWITGPSKIFHPKISITTHKHPACVSSLRELPEPDLVVISQHKSDHCNEATLKQLPPTGTKTIILAEPAAARVIRSWKYFDKNKVRSIPRWEDPRLTGRQTVVRIPVPPAVVGGETGEVTVAFIPQRRDITGLHAAIGITYRPPPTTSAPLSSVPKRLQGGRASLLSGHFTPPASPKSYRSFSNLSSIFTSVPYHATAKQSQRHDTLPVPLPATPTSPGFSLRSVRSVRSASSIPFSRQSTLTLASTATLAGGGPWHSTSPAERPLSVLFSPHGIAYASLSPYVTGHLAAEAALPLTCLLHCFDSVSNPWWLGGNILLGAPAGREIVTRLGARAWVSAHDGDKEVRGIATRLLRTRRWRRDEVVGLPAEDAVEGIDGRDWGAPAAGEDEVSRPQPDETLEGPDTKGLKRRETEMLALGSGEEVVLSGEGLWNAGADDEWDADGKGTAAGEAAAAACGDFVLPMVQIRDSDGGGGFSSVAEVMALVEKRL